MSQTEDTILNENKKQWTLMFFFASDNTLSPSMLPQIKAIKAAGPPNNANVLVYFDPNEQGAPTRVFSIYKSQETGSDGVLSSDYVSPDDMRKGGGSDSEEFAASLENSDGLEAVDALRQFLCYCSESYPAEHYMLFLVGHGLVVGRDAFLPDDNPDSAIGLKTLGKVLNEFKTKAGQQLDLIGMHSCSMSAIEVAYELKGTAKYMLASEGLAFVGAWPYRQMLTKIYDNAGQGDVDALIKGLHHLCIGYGVDFMHAGYSSDMCLCSLDPSRVNALTDPISKLAKALTDGVHDPRCRPLILLAHLRSQSYWQETYTDLYDFCFCLQRLCEQPKRDGTDERDSRFKLREYDVKRLAIIDACTGVMNMLKPESGGPIVCADYVGPDVQYSHGLSIYFPWTRPHKDDKNLVIEKYEEYAFTSEFKEPLRWFKFLGTYFESTKRHDRVSEEKATDQNSPYLANSYTKLLEVAQNTFAAEIGRNANFFPTSVLEGKVSPPDSTGGCTCSSIKNYSRMFSVSPGVVKVFDTKSNNGNIAQPAV